ncbi:MAG: hypothetical protein FWE70_02385 [Oscillospiraceae bacterium]|nr:hypothetical protein [Oscillospiraceae bacterium]
MELKWTSGNRQGNQLTFLIFSAILIIVAVFLAMAIFAVIKTLLGLAVPIAVVALIVYLFRRRNRYR